MTKEVMEDLKNLKRITVKAEFGKMTDEDKELFGSYIKEAKKAYPATVDSVEAELIGGRKMDMREMINMDVDELTKTAYVLAGVELDKVIKKVEALKDENTIKIDTAIIVAKSPILRAFV